MTQQNILLMPFLDESPSFVHGFECGKLWQDLDAGKSFTDATVHNANVSQIKMMCEHFGYEYSLKDCGDGYWHYLTCKPVDISNLNT